MHPTSKHQRKSPHKYTTMSSSVRPSVCLSDIVSAPYLLDGLKDFHETWVTCSLHQGDVQNPCTDHTGSRSRSRLKVKYLRLYFVSAPYLEDGIKDFHETWVTCSTHHGDVQNTCLDHPRSHLKVKGLRPYFVFKMLQRILLKISHMFSSLTWCAELVSRPFRFNVNS